MVRKVLTVAVAQHSFQVLLEPDADYGGYVVECPSLPGCYSQGRTLSEAIANIHEAIGLCLEDRPVFKF